MAHTQPCSVSPHAALLFASARVTLAAADRELAFDAVHRGVHWPDLVSAAHDHGVLPLLHRHTSVGALSDLPLPQAARRMLQEHAESGARRALYLSRELIRLLRRLSDAGIDCVPLKGPVLAEMVYGSVALRRFLDLDILVDEADLSRTLVLLEQDGFRPAFPHPQWIRQLTRDAEHHVALRAPCSKYQVEIHFRLLSPLQHGTWKLSQLTDMLTPHTFHGAHISTLSPEALIVYLCLHGDGHMWSRLEWVCGVSELLKSGRITDWDKVWNFAKRFRAQRAVDTGLLLAHSLLAAPIPAAAPKRLLRHEKLPAAAADRVTARLSTGQCRKPGAVEWFRYAVGFADESGARWRIAWQFLMTPDTRDFEVLRLPRAMHGLYYVIRAANLVLRLSRRAFARRAQSLVREQSPEGLA